MLAFEEGHLRLVAGLNQGLETGLDEVGKAAAEDSLFAEEVSFGLFAEGGLDDTGAGAADALGVSQGHFLGLAGSVLVHSDQIRHAGAFSEGAADEVAGALGGDHDDVHVFGRNDLLEMNVEAMGKGEGLAGGHGRGDVLLVDVGLHFVGKKNHDDVSLLGSFGDTHGFEAVLLGEFVVLTAGALGNEDVHAGIAEVESMGMALAAEAENGNGLTLEVAEISVFVVINFHGKILSHRQMLKKSGCAVD